MELQKHLLCFTVTLTENDTKNSLKSNSQLNKLKRVIKNVKNGTLVSFIKYDW